MPGMRLGGIDPSILRELSGVYKPFVKAFKELISNGFDADATEVQVSFSPDLASVTVKDNGCGMTPFEFRNDFTRIGGGSRRWAGDRTRGGRLRIGSKGIGFLALARYCDRLIIESSGDRPFEQTIAVERTPATVNLLDHLIVPIPPDLLREHLTVEVRRDGPRSGKLTEGKDFIWKGRGPRLAIQSEVGPATIKMRIDCRALVFRATLEFETLLRLADNADLESIDEFAAIEVSRADPETPRRGSRITADQLKPFVRRELRAERRKGFVRNVGSRSGFEQFLWALSRCTPVPYATHEEGSNAGVSKLLTQPGYSTLDKLTVSHGRTTIPLRRPVYPLEPGASPIPPDMLLPVAIDEGGVVATGFLAGYESIIFPAEYRGISIRVRGVSIGDPGYLGAELLLTGPSRAALSQITGEIIVLSGLDAVDTLNPGRESFYEESDHYKILRRHVIGEGEKVGGYLHRAIQAVLRRSQVRSALADVLGRVSLRRRALEDVSAAVTQLIARGDQTARAIRQLLLSDRNNVNGLGSAPRFELGMPPKIGGLTVVQAANLREPAEIDYSSQQIRIDGARDEWKWTMLLFDRQFEVIHKKGKPDQPIAEMDLKKGRILVNWGHPVKLQLDEKGFLRTALAWVLAREAGEEDPSQMMDLALKLLAFTTSTNG